MTPPSVPDPQDPANAANNPPPPPPPPPAATPPPPPAGAYGSAAPTPPPAPGGARPGELLDRFLAKLIDGVIIMVVNVVLVTFIVLGTLFSRGNSWLASSIGAIISALIYVGYLSFMESNRGQTVGKMLMKLRVVGPNGGNPTMEEAVKRNIWAGLGILGVVPIIGGLVGSLASLVAVIMIAVGINGDTVNRQAWHDKFAGGTRVIKEG